jgi:hypothetical protein
MADWRRPDASRLFNDAGEGEGMSPYPILYHDVLDQLELPHADSDQWWISTLACASAFAALNGGHGATQDGRGRHE